MKQPLFRLEPKRDIFLYSTEVSNLFINEMLPQAPGDFVKVYLFGLMYAQSNMDLTLDKAARYLKLSERTVIEALEFWERHGLVRTIRSESGDLCVEFVRQIEALYGQRVAEPVSSQDVQNQDAAASAEGETSETLSADERMSILMDDRIRRLNLEFEGARGGSVALWESEKIKDCLESFGVTYDVFSYAIKYCRDIDKVSINYIAQVAIRWAERGCKTIGDVKELLDEHSQRNSNYGKIFTAVGFNRLPNPSDREMMDRWFDEWGYSIGEVLEACKKTAGLRDPSLKYVNKVLESMMLEKGGVNTSTYSKDNNYKKERREGEMRARVSKQVLEDYYQYIRATAEQEQEKHVRALCALIKPLAKVYEDRAEVNRRIRNFDFASSTREERKTLKARIVELDQEKKALLRANGYTEDYLDRKYKCMRCKDTGSTDDGAVCTCSAKRAEEAFEWMIQKSKH